MIRLESSGFATDHGQAPPSVTNSDRDRALVDAYIGGDVGAFAVIFNDHHDALLKRARRLLGPIGQPEDACQDTFRKALEGIWRFGWTGEYRLGAWLNTILHNVCVDQLARIRRERDLAEAMSAQPQDEADVAEQVPDLGRMKAVQEAMCRLRPELRRALLLREMEGLSYAQVAVAEHISEDNARARAYRARRFVQRQLPASGQPTGAGISLGHQSTVKRVA
ncbi:MAG TPA: RNA polymerase sigma factor [Acidimicrobiales bacterium]|nr:RNA polymerase sigma factor [Acidimicrobiales bacterium]